MKRGNLACAGKDRNYIGEKQERKTPFKYGQSRRKVLTFVEAPTMCQALC